MTGHDLCARLRSRRGVSSDSVCAEVEDKVVVLLSGIIEHTDGSGDPQLIGRKIRDEVSALLQMPILAQRFPNRRSRKFKTALTYLDSGLSSQTPFHIGNIYPWGTLLSWIFTHRLGEVITNINYGEISRAWIDEWLLGKIITKALIGLGLEDQISWRSVSLIKFLNSHQDWYERKLPKNQQAYHALQSWLSDHEIQQFLGINRYQGILWFNRESFEELLWWMFVIRLIKISAKVDKSDNVVDDILSCYEIITRLNKAAEASGYQVEALLDTIKR